MIRRRGGPSDQGRSGAPGPGPYTVRMLALDVAALVRSLDRPEPVHVIGRSAAL
jgi:pimeloyl-ACP methyl ester carboxylesterase